MNTDRSAVTPYEREDAVDRWLKVYETEKEREFIRCVDRFIPKDKVSLLDMGCGTGLHSALWSERNKQVTAADFSTKFRDYVLRTYPFPFIWMDVLNCEIKEQYDVCFCMAIATILLDEERRFQTFATLARLLRTGSFLVLVTASNQWPFRALSRTASLHSIDERDLEKLAELGFEVERVFYWSTSPKSLWRLPGMKATARLLETIASRVGVGARKVVICRRKPVEG